MAINASAVWRVRIGGNDLNGGAFDPDIVGAGTDYSEQDAAQLAPTDLTTSGASAVINSAAGGFTAAMIGNAVRIASGTNFTVGTYFITAVGSTNAATLDRNCSTGSGSGGVAKVGGAHASVLRAISAGIVTGNLVLIRGQGSNDPVDIDYPTATYLTAVTGTTYVGYYGRPKIGHTGLLFNSATNCLFQNLYFLASSAAVSTYGAVAGVGACLVENCVFDSGGQDVQSLLNCSARNSSFINTGSQLPATKACIVFATAGDAGTIENCHIKDQKGVGISCFLPRQTLRNNIIQNCAGDGIYATFSVGTSGAGMSSYGNTIHGCGGHGINTDSPNMNINDNLISGITEAGKYGLYYRAFTETKARNYGRVGRNNFHGNTDNSNYALSALDTTFDPGYVNAPTDLTPTNTALRYLSGVGSL